VLAGVGLISKIVLLDPRRQRLIASHGDGIAVRPAGGDRPGGAATAIREGHRPRP